MFGNIHITLDIMMMNTKTAISPVQETNAQQFLNNDVLEIIIKLLLFSFPFMRNNLKAVNRFFRATVDWEAFPIIYIPEFAAESTTISVRSIITLKGKRSGAVIRLKEIMAQASSPVIWLVCHYRYSLEEVSLSGANIPCSSVC